MVAAQNASPDAPPLARLREHALAQLRRQPDYTCVETVERSERPAVNRKFNSLDKIRFEVALIDGKEMFGWLGAEKFDDTDLRHFVRNGAIGTGDFALHARAIFGNANTSFFDRGEADSALRYDFEIPQSASFYKIRVASHEAVVGYHGSVLADPKTLDLRRIDVIADRIPAALGLASAENRLTYDRVKIGASDFLLPSSGELVMTDSNGEQHRNAIRFSACREFAGESTLRFDDGSGPSAAAPQEVTLPADLGLQLSLLDDVDTAHAAIGDPVRARLENDIKEEGRVVFKKGAVVIGRITRLDKFANYTALGLSFTEIETNTVRAHFHAVLEQVPQEWFLAPRLERTAARSDPGEGILTLHSGRVRLGRGILMFWRTRKS